ncbi:MAG: DHH family phosphoesterase [Microgenomates group bacterium]
MDEGQLVVSRIGEIINKGASGVILTPPNSSIDTIAAATALYLALNKMGKNISLACSAKIDNIPLTAADKFQTDINVSGDSLTISFPYIDGSIDRVDYNIQGENFNLIITPRPGYKKLDPSQVKFSYTGGKIDFFIIVDAASLNALGDLYLNNKEKFVGCEIINIDRHLTNNNFGTVNFVKKTAACLSEIIFELIENLKLEVDRDIATNLYAGILAGTNNFTSYSVNAQTLETAAKLLKAGAVKKVISKTNVIPSAPNSHPFSFGKPTIGKPSNIMNSSLPKVNKIDTKPLESVEKEVAKEPQETPQDWLKPKIFRGGGLI